MCLVLVVGSEPAVGSGWRVLWAPVLGGGGGPASLAMSYGGKWDKVWENNNVVRGRVAQ